jgi:multiple sugar transport system permease protein
MELGVKKSRRLARLCLYIALSVITAVYIFPLFWMVSTSLKTLPQIAQFPPLLFPKTPIWMNYPDALTFLPFHLFFRNTMIIAVFYIAGNLISATFIAYGFARMRFPGREVLFIILVSTMMIPMIVRLIPLFLIFKRLGWINTFYPLIVPEFFGNPFFIFLVRQFYRTIPMDISDAARLDGCSELGIWWRMMIPLSKPVLAAVVIFAFQRVWNDFLAPLIYLNKTEMKTLSLGLQAFTGGTGEAVQLYNLLMAACTTFVFPMIILFLFAQKYFIRGIVVTGMKG